MPEEALPPGLARGATRGDRSAEGAGITLRPATPARDGAGGSVDPRCSLGFAEEDRPPVGASADVLLCAGSLTPPRSPLVPACGAATAGAGEEAICRTASGRGALHTQHTAASLGLTLEHERQAQEGGILGRSGGTFVKDDTGATTGNGLSQAAQLLAEASFTSVQALQAHPAGELPGLIAEKSSTMPRQYGHLALVAGGGSAMTALQCPQIAVCIFAGV